MSQKRGGLLAQIEAGVLDDTVPLSSLLQKCIVLGGQAGSEKRRDWARRELNGYAGAETVPDYRHIPAAVMVVITNSAGYNGITQQIDDSVFPDQIRSMIREKVDLKDAILGGGIGELEALASQNTEEHRLIPGWASFIASTLNQFNMRPNSRVAEVYWSVSNASIRGLLVRVRTALAELVAELIMLTPQCQEVPDKACRRSSNPVRDHRGSSHDQLQPSACRRRRHERRCRRRRRSRAGDRVRHARQRNRQPDG